MTGPPALLLVAHGSRDPRAAEAVERCATRVRALLPDVAVRAAFVELTEPAPADALAALADAGKDRVVLVPFLLTTGYHVAVDVPAAVRRAVRRRPGLSVTVTPALGPDPLLLAACDRRAREAGVRPADPDVVVVLVAAGSSDPGAVAAVEEVARRYGDCGWATVVPSYVSQAAPVPEDALRSVRGTAPGTVLVSYLLAPGRFQDRLAAAARVAGVPLTAPLADTPEVAELVTRRYHGDTPVTARRNGRYGHTRSDDVAR